MLLLELTAIEQNGNIGINAANSQLKSCFESGINLMYAVGAMVSLIGAQRINILFQ